MTVEVPQRTGDPLAGVDPTRGSGPDTTVESLAGLRPAFDAAGNVTAGNASQITDGASALVLMSQQGQGRALGVTPLGEVIGYGQMAGPDTSLLTQPSRAIRQALARTG